MEGDAGSDVDLTYEPPVFEYTEDYFSKFWTSFVDNEKILNEIQDVAQENQRSLNQIYNLEDFYENNLLPKMFAFPNQYISRVTNNRAAQNQKQQLIGGPATVQQSQKENCGSIK